MGSLKITLVPDKSGALPVHFHPQATKRTPPLNTSLAMKRNGAKTHKLIGFRAVLNSQG